MTPRVSTASSDEEPRRPDLRLVRRLLAYMRPYSRLALLALGSLFVAAATQVVGPLLTRLVIDQALPAGDVGLVRQVALVWVVVLLVQFAAAYGETVVTALLGQRVMRDLRAELFARLQALPVSYFDRTPVGRLVTRVTSDVESLNELFSSGVVSGLGDLITLVAIGVVMLVLHGPLALAAFVVIPLVLLVSRVFQRRVRVAYREIRARLAQLNAHLGERLTGMRVVQLFGRERAEQRRFAALNEAHLDAHLRSITMYALYFPVIEFLTTLALASLLVRAGVQVGDGMLTLGTVAAFLQLVRRFFQPLQDLSEKFNVLQAAMAAAERIFALLDTPPAPGTAPTPDREARVQALREQGVTVEFDDVWFAYPHHGMLAEDGTPGVAERGGESATGGEPRWVVRGVSFRVEPGRTVALVGHTGAGKSTIVNLLLRYYEPQRGRILVNGTDLRDIPVDVLRSLVGYVPQDLFLFAGDVAMNIGLSAGRPHAELEAAAARVGADRVIAGLPGGWAHRLGERGAGVSVGERQLLAFARAIASDPAVLLLDEATSAVDSHAEAILQQAVGTLMAGRTTLAIAHRLSTVVDAHEILVLHHGEVVERGDHRRLLALRGHYERLIRLQGITASAHDTDSVPALRLPTPVTSG
jgi:ATP-binding cassette, subfamily B, multidrug efflux pump